MTAKPLDGRRILITRPAGQAEPLAAQVVAAGGEPLLLPMLRIESLPGTDILHAVGQDTALVIFISVHAATAVAEAQQRGESFAQTTRVAAIGAATAECLRANGIRVDYQPATVSSSESLLDTLKDMTLKNCQVVIYRGQQGREKLASELHQRGARVTEVECYRRVDSEIPVDTPLQYWLADSQGILSLTSVDILDRLLKRVAGPDQQQLLSRSVAVFSQRIADACRQRGFHGQVCVCQSSNDQGMLDALIRCVS